MAKLIFFGHATVLIETNSGKRIMIDPFLEENPLCPDNLQNPGPLDIICLTHGHFDHVSSILPLAEQCDAEICATFELCSLLAVDGIAEERLQRMNKGGSIDIDGISISLVQAMHSSSYQCSDGSIHYAGEACGIVIELETGEAIYHAGDTCLFSDMELIAERFAPQIALMPIGDRFTMGPEDAAKAVEIIQPQIVIPIHHSTFPALSGTPEEFERLCQESESSIVVLAPGEFFEF
jgi:L-ascorbate metabolism protein UlaG (beta-lactamase superfamily)